MASYDLVKWFTKGEYIYIHQVGVQCALWCEQIMLKTRNIAFVQKSFVLESYIKWFSNLAFTADLTSDWVILKEATSLDRRLSHDAE